MTPQNTPASDEGKCETGCKTFTGNETKHHVDCVFYPQSLSKIYDESHSEISKLRELLERAIPFIQQLVNDYAPSETKKERKILADYAALTKGEKE